MCTILAKVFNMFNGQRNKSFLSHVRFKFSFLWPTCAVIVCIVTARLYKHHLWDHRENRAVILYNNMEMKIKASKSCDSSSIFPVLTPITKSSVVKAGMNRGSVGVVVAPP